MSTSHSLPTVPHPITMDHFSPSPGALPKPASVVVAYGTEALQPPFDTLILNFCRKLAGEGFTVVLPHFLESTGTHPGTTTVIAAMTASAMTSWRDAIVAAASWCRASAPSDPVGLVGFSLGGHMALQAAVPSGAKAVVDFFGPVMTFGLVPFPGGMAISQTEARALPTIQIHHGRRDVIVGLSESRRLAQWRNLSSLPCELYEDYDCGHPGQPESSWTTIAQTAATDRTIRFLKTELQ